MEGFDFKRRPLLRASRTVSVMFLLYALFHKEGSCSSIPSASDRGDSEQRDCLCLCPLSEATPLRIVNFKVTGARGWRGCAGSARGRDGASKGMNYTHRQRTLMNQHNHQSGVLLFTCSPTFFHNTPRQFMEHFMTLLTYRAHLKRAFIFFYYFFTQLMIYLTSICIKTRK